MFPFSISSNKLEQLKRRLHALNNRNHVFSPNVAVTFVTGTLVPWQHGNLSVTRVQDDVYSHYALR